MSNDKKHVVLRPRGKVPLLPGKAKPLVRAANVGLDLVSLATSLANEHGKETVFSGIRLVRAAVAGSFLQQLTKEWEHRVERGRIKEDYGETDQAKTMFADGLEAEIEAATPPEAVT